MTATNEPRRARSTFEWHLRGLLLDFAALIVAFGAATLAGALALGFFTVGARSVYTMSAMTGASFGDQTASHPAEHPVAMSSTMATIFVVIGIVFAAVVMWHVFKIASRAADRALDRFALLPPPFAGQR